MRKYIKRIGVVLVFAILMTSTLWWLGRVLRIKRFEGISTVEYMYGQVPNTVDVLLIGSSHVGMNLDMEPFWNEYGIPVYALWGSLQPMWNTYYNLKEALKTQSPKVVVLDVYAATFTEEYMENARQEINLMGMKFNQNKIDAIRVSAPKDRWVDLILEYPLYHTRITDLKGNDFEHFPWRKGMEVEKGTGWRYGMGDFHPCDPSYITEITPIHPKQEEYLRKIIALCQTEGIPLVLVKTPTISRETQQAHYNRVQQIADECGVPFYNMNLMDDQTHLVREDYWFDGHLNTNGARKASSCLAGLLKEAYDLPDRRGDENYKSWDEYSDLTRLDYLTLIEDPINYMEELKRYNYSVIVMKNSMWNDNDAYLGLLDVLEKAHISSQELHESHGGAWMLTGARDGRMQVQEMNDQVSRWVYDNQIFTVGFRDEIGLRIGGKKISDLDSMGITLAVYDNDLHQCVDVVNFFHQDGFQMTRPEPLEETK